MNNIGGKEKDLPWPSNFHIDMTYILSAMFRAKNDQPPIMKGDYSAAETNNGTCQYVEEAGQGEPGQTSLPEQSGKNPERIYSDKIVFVRPNLTLANHLRPIYVTADLEGVTFQEGLDRWKGCSQCTAL